jgi:hypothetical protein
MWRWGSIAAGLSCLCAVGLAQTPAPLPVPSPAQAAAPAPYVDRVIEGRSPLADDDEDAQSKYDSSGLPRSYSLEALSDQRQSQLQNSSSTGLKASGFADTLNYGSLSGSITLQNQSVTQGGATTQQPQRPSLVFRQIGMPFDGGWRADNALGNLSLPTLDMARGSQRVSVPTPAMQGLTSEWRQGRDFGFVIGVGEPGRFSGFPVTAFDASPGSYGAFGVQNRIRTSESVWSWGALAAQARGVLSALATSPKGQAVLDAQGVYLGVRRDSGKPETENFVQLNALSGNNTGTDFLGNPNPAAKGLWMDGSFGLGAYQHSWGLFRLEPGLAWLDLAMASDLKGGYWRMRRANRQWQNEASLEVFESLSGITPTGYFVSDNLRYQYSTSTSFGGSVSVRRYGTQAQSLMLYSQFTNDWGSSRAQVELASADTGERQLQLKLDHDWSTLQDIRLSTSLFFDRNQRATTDIQGYGVAVNADWAIGNKLSLTNSFLGRWSTDQTQYSLNAGLNWRIAPQWSLQGTLYAIQGTTTSAINLAQSPLTPPVIATSSVQDSGVSVVLRYDVSAGRAQAPIGGLPGSAAGGLRGSVFLDDNQNGKREASERGAPNVTVVLDGRFAAETDAQGRFEFPYVAAGPHVVTVISDNLPLPWGLNKEGRTEVRVFTRDTTNVDIGAIRQ